MIDRFVRGMSHPVVYRSAGVSAAFCLAYGPISVWGLPNFSDASLPLIASGVAFVVASAVPLISTFHTLKANRPISEESK
jgi:hypothetical protein